MFYHLACINRKEIISPFLTKQRIPQTSLYKAYVAQAVASQSTYLS